MFQDELMTLLEAAREHKEEAGHSEDGRVLAILATDLEKLWSWAVAHDI